MACESPPVLFLSSRQLNADECVLETEVTNLGALGLYRLLDSIFG